MEPAVTTSSEEPATHPSAPMVRRLAAILSADVEGYSRLMGADEAATIQTLTEYRAVIAGLVDEHRGRIVNSAGDNVLAEFASVVDAVQCGVAIQGEIHARNAGLPPPRRMKFRLGINLGDVVTDGPHIYGDGVNIAARLESLAEGGGICIAGSVYEQIKSKLPLSYQDMGTQAVKNIAEPIRVYRVRTEPGLPAGTARRRLPTVRRRDLVGALGLVALLGSGVTTWRLASPPPAGATPSIAVLPFVNMSGDAGQEHVSDGMTEDLITELERLSGLLVIARNSVFTYKGKAVKPQDVGRELGVRYMVEGSVRRADNRLRITAQLVDTTTGYHIWAQKYDRDLQDIFAVQADIARMITTALAVRLTTKEDRHMGRPYTTSPEAWELYQQGTDLYRRFTPKDNARARDLFEKAIELDPAFARAYSNLAGTHRQDGNMEWTQDRETSEDLAYRMALKAVELARREPEPQPSLPFALEQLGYVYLYRKQHAEAADAAKEAVTLSPNFADGYALGAHVLIYWGRPQAAVQQTQEARRRNPKAPFFYDYHEGHAHYVWGYQDRLQQSPSATGHFEAAVKHLGDALERNKGFRPARAYLVAALSELGQHQEAAAESLKLRDTGRPQALKDPQRFREYIERSLPYDDYRIKEHLIALWTEAERKAAAI